MQFHHMMELHRDPRLLITGVPVGTQAETEPREMSEAASSVVREIDSRDRPGVPVTRRPACHSRGCRQHCMIFHVGH
jgi:hypothetical protein